MRRLEEEVGKKDAKELSNALLRGSDTVVLLKGIGIDRRMAFDILETLESLGDDESIKIQYEAWQKVG